MNAWSGCWRLLYRLPALLLHLLFGLPLTLVCYSKPLRAIRPGGRALNEIMQCWWASTLCRIFGLRSRVSGGFIAGPCLIAANHISWLDIQVLHGISPMGFVAKAEIEGVPLAGWVAAFGETVFHHRGSHDSASNVMGAMSQRLLEGRKVAIFPEGGILPGEGVKHFHARLFAAAIDSEKPVQPVMLRYSSMGRPYPDITFQPKESFPANFFRLLRQPACLAHVYVLAPIASGGKRRRALAAETQAAVEAAYAGALLR